MSYDSVFYPVSDWKEVKKVGGYNSFVTNLVRAQAGLHSDWEGELPPPMTRRELQVQMEPTLRERGFSEEQIEDALNFFTEYESRYYEDVRKGRTYHRPCKGGAMRMEGIHPVCRKCGPLSDLLLPDSIR